MNHLNRFNAMMHIGIFFTLLTVPMRIFAANMCDFLPSDKQSECNTCLADNKAYTAIGCIDTTTPTAFIGELLTRGIAIAGGIAFLLVLFGGFQILTSAGNPERLEAGRELVSAALAGLLLLVFSIFILRVIGIDILHLPDWAYHGS
jgi:hypothetical protein